MTAQTIPVVTPRDTGSDDDLLHTVCSDCDEDTALCGASVPGDCWTFQGLECVVCEDLAHLPCPGCGA